jgi:hypothetical protein
VTETALVRLVADETEASVCCRTSRHVHRLMGRLTLRGLTIWCKECRAEHLVPWEEIERVRQSLALKDSLRYTGR